MHNHKESGFTLIELSIVLVIIGLIVGGILVGRDLIRAAEVRATITQIEKYNQEANTFRTKYGYLPGDITANAAALFGFAARGTACGEGDGNGVIAGSHGCWGHVEGAGETAMFWVDLSQVNMVEGSFTTASASLLNSSDFSGTGLSLWFPAAKIGNGNYVYVWSMGTCEPTCYSTIGMNFFGISSISLLQGTDNAGKITSTGNITVAQAYAIDSKIDDGLPQTGRVLAMYVSNDPVWSDSTWGGTDSLYVLPPLGPQTAATSPHTNNCFDNGGVTGNTQQYSVTYQSGSNAACGLSFLFQ